MFLKNTGCGVIQSLTPGFITIFLCDFGHSFPVSLPQFHLLSGMKNNNLIGSQWGVNEFVKHIAPSESEILLSLSSLFMESL